MGKRLQNKVALITGATGGIGAATAKLFAHEGAKIVLADIDEKNGKALAHEIGSAANFLKLDVTQESNWEKAIEYLEAQYGTLDILVNNAGIMTAGGDDHPQNPEHCSLEDWRKVLVINLDGVFLGCKYAIELMKKHSGSIVNVGSRSAFVGIPGAAAYASSKAAIRNHTKTVALYCAAQDYPIRCNCVHPGPTLTPIWEKMLSDPNTRAKAIESVAQAIPLKRLGKSEEIAYGILYFASEESSYTTGAELIIDGGVLAGSAGVALKK